MGGRHPIHPRTGVSASKGGAGGEPFDERMDDHVEGEEERAIRGVTATANVWF